MLLLTILMTGFAAVYYGMNHAHDQFRGLDTRIDGIYFTVTTLSTVGYGDITAVSQTGRVGHRADGLDIAYVGIAFRSSRRPPAVSPRWAPRHGRRGRRHLRRGRGMPVRARQCGSRWIHGDESAPGGSARTDGGARRLRAPDGRMPHARRGQRRRRASAGYAVLEAYLLHVRTLSTFLGTSSDRAWPDDVVADDYFRGYHEPFSAHRGRPATSTGASPTSRDRLVGNVADSSGLVAARPRPLLLGQAGAEGVHPLPRRAREDSPDRRLVRGRPHRREAQRPPDHLTGPCASPLAVRTRVRYRPSHGTPTSWQVQNMQRSLAAGGRAAAERAGLHPGPLVAPRGADRARTATSAG